MRIEQGFQPSPFPEQNVFLTDPVLPSLLKRILPLDVSAKVLPDLERLGDDVINVIRPLGSGPLMAKPTITQYDQWGRRVDALHTSEGWRKMKAISQQEGLPAIFYERQFGEYSRVYGFAKMLLMVGDTQEVFCPMSMTDGAARVLELFGNDATKEVYDRLISRDPGKGITAGQWMTERPGGSDVSLTETTAVPLQEKHSYGDVYFLNGVKWFSSATDSEISVALARTDAGDAGARGLSLFLIPLRLPLFPSLSEPKPSPISNNIFIHRLKDKIGTHALPTAELSLEGTKGYLIGPLNKGVKSIIPVLNITRVWSAVTSCGHLRKCLEIAASYATVRRVRSGTLLLSDSVIHVERLAQVSLLYRALTHMVFGVVRLMGKVECNGPKGGEQDSLRLRMLTPLWEVRVHMEENGFGRAIRDAMVEKIWEGTVVVLALDLTRAARDPRVLKSFIQWAEDVIVSWALHPLIHRPGLILVGYLTSSLYLLEHAAWSWTQKTETKDVDVEVVKRWALDNGLKGALEDVQRAMESGDAKIELDKQIAFGAGPPLIGRAEVAKL
ncbi:acyl-CoA dehydrogenase domain-containing protein [Coprinellus micaceus]|uniref:Acyl-CoA dehydrogenase domain-containing protein n=1 Tax=Coprinellus micaceus TaxID=71717 RepID=A0A4Y7TXV4_COPMI|nr:acyl-CoA dehydrogenase domain-containing protein [Coprinellus micaceus]